MAVRDMYPKLLNNLFQHYDNGNIYCVDDICLDVTKKVHVVYYMDIKTEDTYVRTVSEFMGYVDRPNPQTGQMERVRRFKKVARREET